MAIRSSQSVFSSRLPLIAACLLSLSPATGIAEPQGGAVIAGSGQLSTSPGSMTIDQFSHNMVMDWQSFDIAQGEAVSFHQPAATSSVLNRIFSQDASQILGNLSANGNVFLFNSNGILFGDTASVNVGGLVATSLAIDPGEFMAGVYRLAADGSGDGLLVNRGLIQAATGGVSFISDTGVINEGRILARRGVVNLATAEVATLDFDGDGLLRLQISGEVSHNLESLDSAVSNSGEIHAVDGEVLMTGSVARDVFTDVVNNSGIVTANSIVNEGGVVRLVAHGGDTINSGRIEARSALGKGGEVQVLGDRVALTGDARVDASGMVGGGEVLIGGDFQGANPDIANASHSYISTGSQVRSDAGYAGDGGKVIVWADEVTRFHGHVSAEAGVASGDGGFVEVSGKAFLDFDGTVSTLAANGDVGTLLLDPRDINIVDQSAAPGADDGQLDEGTSDRSILFGDPGVNPDTTDFTISEGTLESLTSNVILQAHQDIIITDLTTDGVLDFSGIGSGESVVFQAGRNITFNNTANTLQTAGGDIHLEADSSHSPTDPANGSGGLTLGNLASGGGDIRLIGNDNDYVFGGTITAGAGDVVISVAEDAQPISIGTGEDLTPADIAQISSSGTLVIGAASSAGPAGDFVMPVTEYAGAIDIVGLVSIGNGVGTALMLQADGDGTDDFTITNDQTFSVAQNLTIDLDADDDNGEFDIAGTIDAGSNDITIIASEIYGDNDSGQELLTTGAVSLTAAVIGIGGSESQLNISGATSLSIIDTADGNMELNFNGGDNDDIDFSNEELSVANLNSVTSFSYENRWSSIVLLDVSAAGADASFSTTAGNITDIDDNAAHTITADSLVLSATATDAFIDTTTDTGSGELTTISTAALSLVTDAGTGGASVRLNSDVDILSVDTDTGDLNVRTTGSITDSGSQAVGGAAGYTAGDGESITLDDTGNAYTGSIGFDATSGTLASVTLYNTGSLDLQALTSGTLTVTAEGAITDSGTLDISGAASFTAGTSGTPASITLDDTGNDFGGSLDFNGGGGSTLTSIEVYDTTDIELQSLSTSGNLTVTSEGNITDSGAQNVGGIAVFTAGTDGNDRSITLDEAGNAYTGTVDFNAGGTSTLSSVSFVDTTAVELQATTTTGALDVQGTSLSTSGSIDVGSTATLTATTGSISINSSLSAADLDADANTGITATTGAIDVTNTAGFVADGAITLNNAAHNFNTIDIDNSGNAAAVTVVDSNDINLGLVATGGDLSVSAGDAVSTADITDSNAVIDGITVSGNAQFNAGLNSSIVLDNANNDFTNNVTVAALGGTLDNVSLTDATAISLQALNISGDLNIIAASISSAGNLTVGGSAGLTSTTTNISLGGGLSANSLAMSSATSISASSGAVAITNHADIDSSGSITMSNGGNDFDTIDLDNNGSTGTITVVDVDGIELGRVEAGGDLLVTAGSILTPGSITDSNGGGDGQLVTGNATFNIGLNSALVLDNTNNDYQNAPVFSLQGGSYSNFSFTNAGDIVLSSLSTSGVLTIVSGGNVTQSGNVIVSGLTDITSNGLITLTVTSNNFASAVSLDNSGNTATVAITDANSITLDSIAAGGDLVVTAGTAVSAGNIADATGASVVVAGNAVFNAGLASSIVLDSTANDLQGTVDFNSQGGTLSSIDFINDGDIDLLSLSSNGLSLQSQNGGISSSQQVSVNGTTSLDAANGDISLSNASNNLAGTILIIDAANATLVNNNSIALGATVNVAGGTLDLTSSGNVSGAGTIVADTLLIDAATMSALTTNINTLGIDLNTTSNIDVRNTGGLAIHGSGVTAFDGFIILVANSGDIALDNDVRVTNDNDVIIVEATNGSITAGGGVINTTGAIGLQAANGIGAPGTPVETASTNFIQAITTGTGADIHVDNDGALNLNAVFISTAAGTDTVELIADSWDLNSLSDRDFAMDDIRLVADVAGITRSGSVRITNANSITLDAQTGIGTALNPVLVGLVGSRGLDLASAGSNNSGDIHVSSNTDVVLGSLATNSTPSSDLQTVSLDASAITMGASAGDAGDTVYFTAGSGDIDGGGNTLTAAMAGLIASGGISNIITDAGSIAARATTGAIDIDSVFSGGDLVIDDLGSVSGLSTTDQNITLDSQDASIDIVTAIDAGSGRVTLGTSDTGSGDYDIGGSGMVTAGGDLVVTADGGIDGITVNLLTTGDLDLATTGAGAAGDIGIITAADLTTSRINNLATAGATTQDITLSANTWTVNNNLDVGNDNLSLVATGGDIERTSGTLTANDLTLIANSAGAAIGGNSVVGDVITVSLSGELTASAASGAGGIYINSVGDLDISSTGVDAGSGEMQLVSAGALTGTGQLAAGGVLLVSSGDIDVDTTTGALSASAGSGDITIDNIGDLVIDTRTQVGGTVHDGITTSGDLSLSSTGSITDATGASIQATDVSLTTAGGINLDSAGTTTTSFSATDTAGGDISLRHQGTLVITGISTAGNVTLDNDSSVNSSNGAISVNRLTVNSSGGATLDNASNAIAEVGVTDANAGNITIVDNGDLTLLTTSTTGAGNISVTTDGSISQPANIRSGSGDISVESTGGGNITMADGAVTSTTDGTILYRSNGGNISVFLLDAGLNAGVIIIDAQLAGGTVNKVGADLLAPNVSANTVTITSGAIAPGLDFGLDDSIQGTITLNYTGIAKVTSAPLGVDLNIVDNGPGVFNSSGARSAGNQRGQSSGLEDVGFIDAALFSDINLFVVEGTGIALPEDQSDISPEDRRRFRQLEEDAQQDQEAGLADPVPDTDVSLLID